MYHAINIDAYMRLSGKIKKILQSKKTTYSIQ